MISAPPDALRARAAAIAERLRAAGVAADVLPCASAVGGGSLPGETLPSFAVTPQTPAPDELARRLRLGAPPVVGRIADGRLLLDVRTVLSGQDEELVRALLNCLRQ